MVTAEALLKINPRAICTFMTSAKLAPVHSVLSAYPDRSISSNVLLLCAAVRASVLLVSSSISMIVINSTGIPMVWNHLMKKEMEEAFDQFDRVNVAGAPEHAPEHALLAAVVRSLYNRIHIRL